MDTLDKILQLLKEQHKRQIDLTTYLGLHKNAFSNWKSGQNNSYMKYLPQIAEYLGVSVDYLLGNTEIRKGTALSEQPLTPMQEKALNMIMTLPDSALEDLMRFLDALQGNQ